MSVGIGWLLANSALIFASVFIVSRWRRELQRWERQLTEATKTYLEMTRMAAEDPCPCCDGTGIREGDA